MTLAEHYGIPADESIADEEWLRLAGKQGWAVFMKDTRIRYNPAERDAVKAHAVQCFCLSRQNLSANEMAARFIESLEAIERACAEDGPFIYAVHSNRLERLTIGDD